MSGVPYMYFIVDSFLYSAMNIIRKNVIDQFTVPNFIITKYLFKIIVMVPFMYYFWDDFTSKKNLDLVRKNSDMFLVLTVIGMITGVLFKYIIKSTDVTFYVPFSFMLSNIMITALAVVFLGEKVSVRRLGGLGLGMISLWMMAK